jgi:hypothetical protein
MVSVLCSLCLGAAALLALVSPAGQLDERWPRLTAKELAERKVKAGKDPLLLLQLVPLAEDREAAKLRPQVRQLLIEKKQSAAADDLRQLALEVAVALPKTVRTQAEVQEVLGPPRQVLRQILYRRYHEQWVYDSPLPLCVVFDCPKGQDPSLLTVHALASGKP